MQAGVTEVSYGSPSSLYLQPLLLLFLLFLPLVMLFSLLSPSDLPNLTTSPFLPIPLNPLTLEPYTLALIVPWGYVCKWE